MQLTDTILMIRPAAFGYNAETALTNYFQQPSSLTSSELQQKAIVQFDEMVNVLRNKGITVLVIDDTAEPPKPDAIFPNNWICTTSKQIAVFPMQAVSRRTEKRKDIIERLKQSFEVEQVQYWSEYESKEEFLEGTGSMVINHENKIIYACISPRTSTNVLNACAVENGYKAICFSAFDEGGKSIYHTNVMMSIGEGFCFLCEEAIHDAKERTAVVKDLTSSGHQIITIDKMQMASFAGNLLQVKNTAGKRFIVLSQTAFKSFDAEQLKKLGMFGALLSIDVSIIEQVEGGSVRCMMAEIFLQASDSRFSPKR